MFTGWEKKAYLRNAGIPNKKKPVPKMKTLARFYFDVFLALLVNTLVIIKQNNWKFISAGNSVFLFTKKWEQAFKGKRTNPVFYYMVLL